MSTSTPLSILSILVAIGAVAAYVVLFRVAIIRNHPEGYVIAFALATALAALGVARRFLADRDLAVARRFGLVHQRGGPDGQDVPRPATIVLDRDGVVRWFSASRNFQVRPDPGDVLRAVRAL